MIKYVFQDSKKKRMPFPAEHQDSIQKAVRLLKGAGAEKIYLFGSLLNGNDSTASDIDLGIQGLAPEIFFKIYDQLSQEIDTPLDLVDFDEQNDFLEMLDSINEVIQIE